MQGKIEKVEDRIRKLNYNDIFMIISQMEGIQPKNEFEIAQRIGEKIQVLGPMVENFEEEVAIGLQRVIECMKRRDLVPPMPNSLRGVPIKLTYTSFIKLAQLSAQTNAMERTYGIAGKLSEAAMLAQVPPPIRVLNLDESMRYYADKQGFPARLIYSPNEVTQHDQMKAQQAAMAQAAQLAQPAVQAAEGLSRIPAGGGQSALDAVTGMQGGVQE
jgi:hypothetical protein